MGLFTTSFQIDAITLVSLLVNAVTIYKWMTDSRARKKSNDQAFHMVMGLALANTRRGGMVVNQIQSFQSQANRDDGSLMLLQNMYADTNANVETLLAAAKALKPEEAGRLPYDGNALLGESMVANYENQIKQKELSKKLTEMSDLHGKNASDSDQNNLL